MMRAAKRFIALIGRDLCRAARATKQKWALQAAERRFLGCKKRQGMTSVVPKTQQNMEWALAPAVCSSRFPLRIRLFSSALVATAMLASSLSPAQQPSPPTPGPTGNAASSAPTPPDVKPARSSGRRKAAKLYLASGKLFEKEEFEEAMRG